MNPFVFVLVIGAVTLGVWLWLLGRYYPGSGVEQLDLRSGFELSERRQALEAEDLNQMLAAHNARRRARGQAPVSVEDVELRVTQDGEDERRRREQLFAQRELDELLEATNARRRARGLSERMRAQARRELGPDPASGS